MPYRRTFWDTKKYEDPKRCIREVFPPRGWSAFQCSRKRGHGPDGLFCKQHAKIVMDKLALDQRRKERHGQE